jgi:hypothetical protein
MSEPERPQCQHRLIRIGADQIRLGFEPQGEDPGLDRSGSEDAHLGRTMRGISGCAGVTPLLTREVRAG